MRLLSTSVGFAAVAGFVAAVAVGLDSAALAVALVVGLAVGPAAVVAGPGSRPRSSRKWQRLPRRSRAW